MRFLVAENDPSLTTFLNAGFGGEHEVVQVVENVEHIKNMGRIVNSPRELVSESPERSNLDQMQKQLQSALAAQIGRHTVSATPTKEGIVVSLNKAEFFDSGSALCGRKPFPPSTTS